MPDEQRDDIDRVEDDDDIGRLNDLFASTFDAATLDQVLHGAGVHPDDIVTLLRYAPLGLTHLCWRNTVLEDWHAGPESRIHDGDMMRGNVATTRLFAQALWAAFADQIADAELMCRADFTDEDIDVLAGAFADALEGAFSAERTLPHGVTLGELGGDQVAGLYDHAATQLGAPRDLKVPPTSNQAERDLPPSKIQQAISGRLTSQTRTQDRYTIRGYLSTAAKHHHNIMDALHDAILGRPWMPPDPAHD